MDLLSQKKPSFAMQCQRCGFYVLDQHPEKCEKCGCPSLRRVSVKFGLKNADFDHVDPDAVKHFTTPLLKCLNYDFDPITHTKIFHDLKLEKETFIENGLVKVTERCKECGLLYSNHAFPVTRVDVAKKLGIDINDLKGPQH